MSLFISLEIDCFQTSKIDIEGENSRAGFSTALGQ